MILSRAHTVYVPIDAHCASADLRVRVYLKKIKKKNLRVNNNNMVHISLYYKLCVNA